MCFYKGDYENALKDYDEGIARLNAPKDLPPRPRLLHSLVLDCIEYLLMF
jgi:hypothetical protein